MYVTVYNCIYTTLTLYLLHTIIQIKLYWTASNSICQTYPAYDLSQVLVYFFYPIDNYWHNRGK